MDNPIQSKWYAGFDTQGRDVQNRVIEMPALDGKVWAEFPDGRTEEL